MGPTEIFKTVANANLRLIQSFEKMRQDGYSLGLFDAHFAHRLMAHTVESFDQFESACKSRIESELKGIVLENKNASDDSIVMLITCFIGGYMAGVSRLMMEEQARRDEA